MLYMYHVAQKLRKETVSDRFMVWAANKWNGSLQNTWPINRTTNIDHMRVFLFNKGNGPGRFPSISGALKLHIRRAHYQTTTWLNVTVPSQEHIDLKTCAWLRDPYSNQLKPKMLLLEPIPKVCKQLLQCSCKVCSTRRCKFRSNTSNINCFRLAAVVLSQVAIHWMLWRVR